MNNALVTSRQAAEILGVPEGTLGQWRFAGRGPKFVKVGRMVRYRVSDIDEYLEERTVTSTAPFGLFSDVREARA